MRLSSEYIMQLQKSLATMPVLKAYVFGSYARGEATTDSDIDLLVELDYSNGIGFKFIEMQEQLSNEFAHKIDLVSSNGLSPYIAPIVHREKVLIYER
jgi:uncharacterized protein